MKNKLRLYNHILYMANFILYYNDSWNQNCNYIAKNARNQVMDFKICNNKMIEEGE